LASAELARVKLALAEFDSICSAHATVMRAKPEVMLPEFLLFLIMSDCFMNRAIGRFNKETSKLYMTFDKFNMPNKYPCHWH
jgi:hypothetical protein